MVIPGGFQITVQETVDKIAFLVILEIHAQESHLAHYVNPVEIRIELNAVENDYAVVDNRHVAQMHIAMAFANKALFFSSPKRPETRFELLLSPRSHLFNQF